MAKRDCLTEVACLGAFSTRFFSAQFLLAQTKFFFRTSRHSLIFFGRQVPSLSLFSVESKDDAERSLAVTRVSIV
jgi:hypothetical protein